MSMIPGLAGEFNPADVLYKLASSRGIEAPVFDQVSEKGPPYCKIFTWSCSFMGVSIGMCSTGQYSAPTYSGPVQQHRAGQE